MVSSPDTLFKRFREHGTPALMGQVYDLLSPKLLALALRLELDIAQAEDVVQSVFLKVIREPQAWDEDTPLQLWLMNLVAQESERSKQPSQQHRTLDSSESTAEVPAYDCPLGLAQQEELNQRLADAISNLPEPYREVVRLRIEKGLDSVAIGKTLGRPPGTIRSQLARGLGRLRLLMPSAIGLGMLYTSTHGAAPARALQSNKIREEIVGHAASLIGAKGPTSGLKSGPLVPSLLTAAACLAAVWTFAHFQNGESAAVIPQTMEESSSKVLGLQEPKVSQAPAAPVRQAISQAPKAAAPDRSHVFGRVVNQEGEPIAGAAVTLYSGAASGDSPPVAGEVGPSGFDWIQYTDSEGRYSFIVPEAEAECLKIDGGNQLSEFFTFFDGADSPPSSLWGDEHDLGVTTLCGAASMTGRILNSDGTPSYPARVYLTPGCCETVGCFEATKEDGTFEAHNLFPGHHKIRVVRNRVVSHVGAAFLEEGQILELPATPLPPTTALTVQVSDLNGSPIKRVVLEMTSTDGTERLGIRSIVTDAQGQATVLLPTEMGHSLDIRHPKFVLADPIELAPGDTLAQVTLQPAENPRFRVLAADSHEPIANFKVMIKREAGWTGFRGGEAHFDRETKTLTASASAGDSYRITAPGYQSSVGTIGPESPEVIVTTLTPAIQIQGQITLEGVAQSGVLLELVAGKIDPNKEAVSRDHPAQDFTPEFDCYTWARTDSSGAFSMTGSHLKDATYRLNAILPGKGGVLHWFTSDGGSHVQLGELALAPLGSIRGRVIMPEGFNLQGLAISLDQTHGQASAYTDSSGAFTIPNVTPGLHQLFPKNQPFLSEVGLPLMIEVQAGLTAPVVMDLHSNGIVARELRLISAGAPLQGYRVYLVPHADGIVKPSKEAMQDAYLGTTDENGIVRGEVPCAGPTDVWIENNDRTQWVMHPTARVAVDSRTAPLQTIEFAAGLTYLRESASQR